MLALEAVSSGIIYALVAFASGALVTAAFLLPKTEPKEPRPELLRLVYGLLLLYVIFAGFALLLEGAKLRGSTMPDTDVFFRYVTSTQGGKVWLFREVYALALGLTTRWLMRTQPSLRAVRLLALISLPLLVSRSLSSHAVAVRDSTILAISADALHLLATGLWGGGLMALWWVLYGAIKKPTVAFSGAAEMVRRFSLLAFISVGVLFVTGLYQSWIQVESATLLLGTNYGRVLVIKLILFVAMVGLGTLNWLSTKPRLSRAQLEAKENPSLARTALTRIGAESVLGLLVFFVTGLLTTLPPGIHAWHEKTVTKTSSSPGVDNEPHQLMAAEGARVEILSPQPGQIIAGDRVPLLFKLTKGKRGDHVHAYVDGELMGMFMSNRGTLTGIGRGNHMLELRVVAEDHQTELDATARVDFTVR